MRFSQYFRIKEKSPFVIEEGGNAVSPVSPILSEYQKPTFDVLEKEVLQGVLKLKPGEYKALGSTFKKKPGTSSGDMDVAIDENKTASNLGVEPDEIYTAISDKLKSRFPGDKLKVMKGLGVVSIAFPIYDESGKETGQNVQVDLMPTDSIAYSDFVFSSPDFTKDESQYKGVYRTMLLMQILSSVHLNENKGGGILSDIFPDWTDEYPESYSNKFDQEFDGKFTGEDKQVVRFLLDPRKGFKQSVKTHESPKTGKRTKSLAQVGEQVISKDPDKIIKYILGPKYGVNDAKSFETILKIMHSPGFIHKEHYDDIIKRYIKNLEQNKLDIPKELKEDYDRLFKND